MAAAAPSSHKDFGFTGLPGLQPAIAKTLSLTRRNFSKMPLITASCPANSSSGPPAWRLLKGGSEAVAPRGRLGNVNLRTGLQKILRRANVEAWPKLFQNLRASRETELMRSHPAHVVYAWLGNSREVAQDHYLMVTEDDYERAAEKALQNPVHSRAVTGRQSPSQESETAAPLACAGGAAVLVPPRGVEPRFSD